jgi:TorA maturation chaperone TorD
MSTIQAEVQTLSQSRAAIYGFLAWLFLKQPDADFVTRLLANDIDDSVQIFPSGTGSTSRMIDGMKVMRSSLLDNGPRTLEDICLVLAVEHTRFLRGVGRAYGSPPPYESLYRSSETGEDNAFLLKLTDFYRQAQVAFLTENAERVDYIGVELDFMRLLCEEEGHAQEMDDTIQAEHFFHLQELHGMGSTFLRFISDPNHNRFLSWCRTVAMWLSRSGGGRERTSSGRNSSDYW